MKNKIKILLSIVITTLNSSCSKRVLEGIETHKLHDTYFILRKNGHYSIKILPLGAFRMPDSERGRYIISNDTVYFLNKRGKNIFESTGYGIIDSTAATFSYRNGNKDDWRIFDLRKMPTRKEN